MLASPFEWLFHRWLGLRAHGWVDGWILANGLVSVVALLNAGRISAWLGVAFLIYGALRVLEILVNQAKVLLLDPYRGDDRDGKYAVRSYRRILVLALHNYFEVLLWFGVWYRSFLWDFGPDSQRLATPSGALYYSIVTMVTLGYGDIYPQNDPGRRLVTIHLVVAVLMTLVVLARVVAYLPTPRSLDQRESWKRPGGQEDDLPNESMPPQPRGASATGRGPEKGNLMHESPARTPMRYELTRLILGVGRGVASSRDQFEEARRARQGLTAALGVEEKFDVLMENYWDFEMEMLRLTARHQLFGPRGWMAAVGELHTLDRRLLNLLSASRLYIDQVRHEITAIYGDESRRLSDFDKARSSQYDGGLGYRFMEALRNYVQHRSFPINKLTYEARRDAERDLRKYGMTLRIDLKRVRAEGGFKAKILEELDETQELDLKPLVREYMEGLGEVQSRLRASLAEDISVWEATFKNIVEMYLQIYPGETSGLAVVALDEAGAAADSVSIFSGLMERRADLAMKNELARPARGYVTGEIWNPHTRADA